MQHHVNLLPEIVSINPIELCTRKCSFCPRADPAVYKNRNLKMSTATAQRLADDLKTMGFRGRIKISGFGEPVLHKQLGEIISILRTALPDTEIMLITSGDTLTEQRCHELINSGLTVFEISLYDGPEQVSEFESLFGRVGTKDFRLRKRWGSADDGFGPDENFVANNRSGLVPLFAVPAEPLKKVCHVPFYKCVVDWNGTILICDQDWGRRGVMGSLHESSLSEIWFGTEMMRYRESLSRGNRGQSPCNTCDISGDLFGKSHFEQWKPLVENKIHEHAKWTIVEADRDAAWTGKEYEMLDGLNFEQDQLEKLSQCPEDLPHELNRINQYYGTGSIFRRYADLPKNQPLPFSIEHFIPFDFEKPHEHDLIPGLPTFLAANEDRAGAYSKLGVQRVVTAGFAIHYARRLLKSSFDWQEPATRQGTLAFPHKSTLLLDRDFDEAAFADWLLQLPAEYQPVSVCMYWRDCERGKQQLYLDKGIPVYTCGHLRDPDFLLRFVDLCTHFRFTCGNVVGSSCPLSVVCGCHYIHKDFGGFKQSDQGTQVHFSGGFESETDYGQRFKQVARFPYSESDAAVQQRLAEYLTGSLHILEPHRVRELYDWSRGQLLERQGNQHQFSGDNWAGLNQWLPIGMEPGGWCRSEAEFTISRRTRSSQLQLLIVSPPWICDSERKLSITVDNGNPADFVCRPGYYLLTVPRLNQTNETRLSLLLPGEKPIGGENKRLASFRIPGWRIVDSTHPEKTQCRQLSKMEADSFFENSSSEVRDAA